MACYGVDGKKFEYYRLFPEQSLSYQIRKAVAKSYVKGLEDGFNLKVEKDKK